MSEKKKFFFSSLPAKLTEGKQRPTVAQAANTRAASHDEVLTPTQNYTAALFL